MSESQPVPLTVISQDGRAARESSAAPWFSAVALGALAAASAVTAAGVGAGWDRAAALWIHQQMGPGGESIMRAITWLGDKPVAAPLFVGLLLVFLWRRRYCHALGLALIVVGSGGLVGIAKFLVERARPDLFPPLVAEKGYSFPSGHAAYIAALLAALVAFAWPRVRRRGARAFLVVAGGLLAVAVGISRVVLGVHYPSDVLGGFALGGLWVYLYLYPLRDSWLPTRPGIAPSVAGSCIALGLFTLSRWVNPPLWQPSLPEQLVDLACLGLAVWGFWLRMSAYDSPRATREAVQAGAFWRTPCFSGSLLLAAGLCLMLHDLLLLAAFALFIWLWCAAAREARRSQPEGGAARRPRGARRQRSLLVPWRPRRLAAAFRREAPVLGLSMAAVGMIEYREWTATLYPISLRVLIWIMLGAVAAVCLLERRRALLLRDA